MNSSNALAIILLVVGFFLALEIHLIFARKRKELEEDEMREEARQRGEERQRVIEAVFKTSHAIKAFREAYDKIPAPHDIDSVYEYAFDLSSRVAFDTFNFTKRITEHICERKDYYEDIYNKAMENKANWDSVVSAMEEAESIPIEKAVLDEIGIYEIDYSREELSLTSLLLREAPVCDPSFVFYVRYESPARQTIMEDRETFHCKELLSLLELADSIEVRKQTAAYQRQRMTPKKRFEILRKDHFRCCLCGRSQADGVELNVDHFIPIAKGGTSDDNNLWTLCWECNNGKRDYTIPELQELFDQAMMERS